MSEMVRRLAVMPLIAVLVVSGDAFPQSGSLARRQGLCMAMVNPHARISRANFSWLLKISQGSDRHAVIEPRLGSPYCYLATRRIQEAVAYPAAWDPSVWILVIYQGDRYQGYDISYNNNQP
jgi:hypothetical protein